VEGQKNKEDVISTTVIVYPPIRHEDNLRTEGTTLYLRSKNRSDFDEKKRRNTFTKTDGETIFQTTRQEIIKRYEDNLKPEGEFHGKENEPAPKGERRPKMIRYPDSINL